MKHLIIYLSVSLILFSCKKESAEIIEQNEITWNDTQKVRILKVEQTESPNSFPFDIDDLMTVEYVYADDVLKEIIVHRSGEIYVYPRMVSEDNKYGFDLSKDPKYGNIFSWKNSLLNMYNGKITSSHKIYGYPFGYPGDLFRDTYYHYELGGLLNSIEGTGIWREGEFFLKDLKGIELKTEEYENGLLKTYSLGKYMEDFVVPKQTMGHDFKIKATYQISSDVPDGLIRFVNQAVLGLNYIGFEDYADHFQYDLRAGSALMGEGSEDAHASAVAKYRYTFADWIISFGLNDAFSIPNQGNHLIASKHISGRKIVDGTPSIEDTLPVYEYAPVDSTANYPYTHNATNKTLEIAGLKIYYELVD